MIRDALIIHLTAPNGLCLHQLAQTLNVQGYAVSVLNISGHLRGWNPNKEALYLCTDICKESFVDGSMLPVLHSLTTDFNGSGSIANISNPVWMKTNREFVNIIRLYICNQDGIIKSFQESLLKCTLVLIPVK